MGENISFNPEKEILPEQKGDNEQDFVKKLEQEKPPELLYHGSSRKFSKFRVKGRKTPTELKASGRKCVYLHANKEVIKRKYAKEGGYIYEVKVDRALAYVEAIEKERRKKKKTALTRDVWLALPQEIKIVKRIKVNIDGSETVEYQAD